MRDESHFIRQAEHCVSSALVATGTHMQMPQNLWKILNAPFTLFVLSTFALGGISAAFSWSQARNEALRAAEANSGKLTTEISTRLARFDSALQPLVRKLSRAPNGGELPKTGSPEFAILAELQALTSESALSDFNHDNLAALLWRLQQERRIVTGIESDTAANALKSVLALQSKLRLEWEPNVRCEIWGTKVQAVMKTDFTEPRFLANEVTEIDGLLKPLRLYLAQIGAPQPAELVGIPFGISPGYDAEYFCQSATSRP